MAITLSLRCGALSPPVWSPAPFSPLPPWRFVQGSMESCLLVGPGQQPLSESEPLPPTPHLEKPGYARTYSAGGYQSGSCKQLNKLKLLIIMLFALGTIIVRIGLLKINLQFSSCCCRSPFSSTQCLSRFVLSKWWSLSSDSLKPVFLYMCWSVYWRQMWITWVVWLHHICNCFRLFQPQ